MEPKMLANWDRQMDYMLTPEQTEWWSASKLANYKYCYRTEFWRDGLGMPVAVLYTYKMHPLSGERYISQRIATYDSETDITTQVLRAAVNDPIVVALDEFPPGVN